jgi:hypothetical protein
MLDFSKPVTTRDGRKVRILCTDAPGRWPVVGYACDRFEPQGICEYKWHLDGSFHRSNAVECRHDLIQAEEPVVRYLLVNRDNSVAGWIFTPRCIEHNKSCADKRLFKLTFDGDQVTGELVK